MLPEYDCPVRSLRGVGPRREELLLDIGVTTVADLLLLLPFRYLDRTRETTIDALPTDREGTTIGRIASVRTVRGRRRRFIALLEDGSGRLECVWFAGLKHVGRALSPGDLVAVSGKVTRFDRRLQMVHPEVEVVSDSEEDTRLHTGRIIPVYTTSARMKDERMTTRALRRLIHDALEDLGRDLPDPLPVSLRDRYGLLPLPQALRAIHFPDSMEDVEAARRRLAFDELLGLQLYLGRVRQDRRRQSGRALPGPGPLAESLLARLGFDLTRAQQRAIREIWEDLARPVPMHRLLQGDVGSGKTLVALLAMLTATASEAQAALMAPTEILAEQHAATLGGLLGPLGLKVLLLAGKQPRGEREEVLEALSKGHAQIVVGTHALVQEGVRFADLGLVVVDEQHRFGVMQRAALRDYGLAAHLLVMTATPIPRSLALTLYGDLDVTVLDELPPGREPVRTGWRWGPDRSQVLEFLGEQVTEGRQAYVVCPVVEGSQDGDLKAASQTFEDLRRGPLQGLRVGLLHGRMESTDKREAMAAFRGGDIDVLVSTTVVEVGLDVPNATVMVVEHAERFGLSQLHQLRGRVGRGMHASYCVLIADPAGDLTPEARARLDAMAATTDGFRIAEADLEIRGPGQIFGTRQAGLSEFRFADLGRDGDLIVDVRREARGLLDADPDLGRPEHEALLRRADTATREGVRIAEAG